MQFLCPKHDCHFESQDTRKPTLSGHPDCPKCQEEMAAKDAGQKEEHQNA